MLSRIARFPMEAFQLVEFSEQLMRGNQEEKTFHARRLALIYNRTAGTYDRYSVKY